MHSTGVVHFDVKHENFLVFLNDDADANGILDVKLADFGLAQLAIELSSDSHTD